jgi:RNA polymerase sporulation-specific sigma factor
MIDYTKMTDEEVVECSKAGETEATDYLLRKYNGLVKAQAHTLYLIGADTEDLIQEGMIGLLQAIRGYNPEIGSPFFSFAKLCISRQVHTAITASSRKKHSPLNESISFNTPTNQDSQVTLGDTLQDLEEFTNPEQMILMEESVSNIKKLFVQKLSTMEQEVLQDYLNGIGYVEIAERMGKSPKSIDNALQRIRQKLKSVLK